MMDIRKKVKKVARENVRTNLTHLSRAEECPVSQCIVQCVERNTFVYDNMHGIAFHAGRQRSAIFRYGCPTELGHT
jgi:hypothetical protein